VTDDLATAEIVDAVAAAPVTMLIGASEAGKTSLTAALANALAARGLTVAVVDADVGQSEIGPPTTIGLGRVTRHLGRLGDAEPIALNFVGTTSPVREMTAIVDGTGRLVDRARSLGFDRVLVDTSGLVTGDVGRALKRRKIDRVAPDLLVVLERAGECDHIVAPYLARGRPAVLRTRALAAPRRRTDTARREHRARSLAAYLAPAREQRIDMRRVTLRNVRGAAWPADELTALLGALVGLQTNGGELLGIGVVTALEPPLLVVESPADARGAAVIVVGRERSTGG
jgi:polynucleotide 5'-hydroxyl-kinase GRC3/NOL9